MLLLYSPLNSYLYVHWILNKYYYYYLLFVLSWARVRRVRQVSISSELLICGGGVRSILLLPLVARCLETIDVCIWRMFVLCLL